MTLIEKSPLPDASDEDKDIIELWLSNSTIDSTLNTQAYQFLDCIQ